MKEERVASAVLDGAVTALRDRETGEKEGSEASIRATSLGSLRAQIRRERAKKNLKMTLRAVWENALERTPPCRINRKSSLA